MSVTAQDIIDAMTYSSPIEESFEVKGVKVEIWHDDFATNPYDDCDGMAPAIWFYDRHYVEYGAHNLENVIWTMTPGFVSRHWRKIVSILDLDESTVDSDCRADVKTYGGGLSDTRQEYLAERLTELRGDSWGYACDYLDALAALWNLRGIPADTFQSNGHSQGDSARGLIVHTPAWCDVMGVPSRDADATARDMQSEAALYGAWAWGDCYGFTVDDEDSCGGFYGHEPEHIANMIADSVNSVLQSRATKTAAAIETARPDMYQGVTA